MIGYPIPDDVLVHHAAFLGKTRSGKTSSAKTAVERFVEAGDRVCVLDPIKSDWWGLTSSTDGKSPGLPFHILGGPHGHAPLHSSSGKVIGELVGNGALPLSIIDMSEFEMGGLQRFFCAFAEALMRHQRGVLHLVIEEAHEFAPKERSGIGDENMGIYWAKKLATAGGSKGLRLIVATQRTQALHNALLGSCETMIVHRLTAPADQKPVVDWLKANLQKDLAAEIAKGMSSLKTGSAWVCSGEAQIGELVQFPRIATFDNSATPMSDDEAAQVATATVDVEALRALIGEAAAEIEANDPKKLKAEIARLTAELAAKPKPADDTGALEAELTRLRALVANIEQVERRAYDDGKLAGISIGLASASSAVSALRVPEIAAEALPDGILVVSPPIRDFAEPAKSPAPQARGGSDEVAGKRPAAVRESDAAGLQPPSSHPPRWQRILDALAVVETLFKRTDSERNLVAWFAGTSPRSSGYERDLGGMRTAGLIDYPAKGQVAFADAGRKLAHWPLVPPTRRDLLVAIKDRLPPRQCEIIDAVEAMRAGRNLPATREALAAMLDKSARSSSFERDLGNLRTLGLLDYPQPGQVGLGRVLL